MMLIFNLGRADVWPVDDYGIRRGISVALGLAEIPTPKQAREIGEAWRPHRTVASLYLWSCLNTKDT
jgi:methylated-DNA-[protein]-cysteine S-methyltransferase